MLSQKITQTIILIKHHIIPISIFIFALILLLPGLGNVSLQPWDEAWHASIARNLARDGRFYHFTFNELTYQDHPPLGYYSIAISFLLFGYTETAARLPMALYTAGTAVLLYFIAKQMTHKYLAISSSLIFLSSRWMLIRGRTANLEGIQVFFQTLTFYLAYTAQKPRDLLYLWLAYGLAFQTKTTIAGTILPIVIVPTYIILKHQSYLLRKKYLFLSLLMFTIPFLPWYAVNLATQGYPFIERNIIHIGLRDGTANQPTIDTVMRTLLYLRSAIHKWYLPLLASSALSLILIKHRPIRWSLTFLFLCGFPYFIASEAHIWHMLIMVPAIALIIPIAPYTFAKVYLKKHLKFISPLITFGITAITIICLTDYYPEFLNTPKSSSNEAAIARATKQNDLPVLLQDLTYTPTVVFYADRYIEYVKPEAQPILDHDRPFQLITKLHVIQDIPSSEYTISYQNGDSIIAIFR